MATHKYFIEAVGGMLIHKKGFSIQEYTDMIVEPQTPVDEIGIVLQAHMYKIHVCIFLEGKYFTTNRDEAINNYVFSLCRVKSIP